MPPNVIVLAGPNGAGKSTAAPALLRDSLGLTEFVNPDVIAQGLSAFAPQGAAMEASRIMLARLRDLATRRASFAFETTLASRSLAGWLKQRLQEGYLFHLVFLWLPTADQAVARVAERVRRGGHAVPTSTVRRRYDRGLANFFERYRPLATTWRLYDNSGPAGPRLVAVGAGRNTIAVLDQRTWSQVLKGRK